MKVGVPMLTPSLEPQGGIEPPTCACLDRPRRFTKAPLYP